MKNFFRNIKKKADSIAVAAKCKAQNIMESKNGDGYVDTGVKIIIAVVIGGVLLAGLYALFNTTIIPKMQTTVGGMFDYTGAAA